MNEVRLKRLLLKLSLLRRRQPLRPLRHRLRDPALRSFEHHSVAKGAALGVFFGVLFPVAQIVFAIVGAIVLRANVVVAAASTFVSNPFTLPFIYYSAYRLGALLTGAQDSGSEVEVLAEVEEAAEAALEVAEWWPTLLDWVSSVGLPLAIGVVLLALVAALAVYALVFVAWGAWQRITK